MIKNLTIESFLLDLSSKNSTPGGGVVAGLSGQLSASLILMVCNLTIGKKGYEKEQNKIIKFRTQVTELLEILSELTEEDQKAFQDVIVAYKQKKLANPSSNSEIIIALRKAISVPTLVRKHCQTLMSIAKKVALIGNKNAISDAKTAIYLAEAGAKSALENININKESLLALS